MCSTCPIWETRNSSDRGRPRRLWIQPAGSGRTITPAGVCRPAGLSSTQPGGADTHVRREVLCGPAGDDGWRRPVGSSVATSVPVDGRRVRRTIAVDHGWRRIVQDDDWTVTIADGSMSAQWEHSVAVHDRGIWVLTAEDGGASGLEPLGITPVPIP